MDINLIVSLVARYCDYTTLYILCEMKDYESESLRQYREKIAGEVKSAEYNSRLCYIRKYGLFALANLDLANVPLGMFEKSTLHISNKMSNYFEELFPDLAKRAEENISQNNVLWHMARNDNIALQSPEYESCYGPQYAQAIIDFESDNLLDRISGDDFEGINFINIGIKKIITPEFRRILEHILKITQNGATIASILAMDSTLSPPKNFDLKSYIFYFYSQAIERLDAKPIIKYGICDYGMIYGIISQCGDCKNHIKFAPFMIDLAINFRDELLKYCESIRGDLNGKQSLFDKISAQFAQQ